jgi:3-oxoacyl-[acyl-carrier-protein] synthase-3
MIRGGQARVALVVGAETLSRITDWSDRSNCILWGDGAGAVVMAASPEPGIISTHLHADGRHLNLLRTTGGPSDGGDGRCFMRMEGNAVFKMAVNTLDRIVDETLEANGLSKSDIDWLVPHGQHPHPASHGQEVGASHDRVVVTWISTAILPPPPFPGARAGVRDGRIKRGEVLLMEAFGGGFTWGSVLVRY